LHIDTDLLLIITSTVDDLSGGTNIDDLERPRNLKIGFGEFFAVSDQAATRIRAVIRRVHFRRSY